MNLTKKSDSKLEKKKAKLRKKLSTKNKIEHLQFFLFYVLIQEHFSAVAANRSLKLWAAFSVVGRPAVSRGISALEGIAQYG